MSFGTQQSWIYRAVREAPGLARHAVSRYARECGADDDVVAALELCVSEAVTNSVLHAYRCAPQPGGVSVRAECRQDELRVLVRDDGTGLTPNIDSPGVGLGLPIIAQMAHRSEIRAPERGGTEVCMRFSLSGMPDERAEPARSRRAAAMV
jgi:anti-sigma regulatory factor (Ser/Thr protein kinase)